MPKKPGTFRPGIPGLKRARPVGEKHYDKQRGTSHSRGYGSRWQKARATFLKRNPLCRICEKKGKVVPSTVVDHIIPARIAPERFWDKTNWQPLCVTCHNRKTIRESRS